jgi:hypothetical protein
MVPIVTPLGQLNIGYILLGIEQIYKLSKNPEVLIQCVCSGYVEE